MKTIETENTPLSLDGVDGVIFVPGKAESMIKSLKRCREFNIRTAVILKGVNTGPSLPEEIEELAEKKYLLNGNGNVREGVLQEMIRKAVRDLGIVVKKTVLISADRNIIDRAGGLQLAMKIGITGRGESRRGLYESGANLVLDSMGDISFSGGDRPAPSYTQEIPSLFRSMTKFRLPFKSRKPVFFFDYDGTLTPIIRDPAKAFLPNTTRKLLQQLSEKATVAVVSGRDMHDIHEFIHLEGIIYAGSHGFRISGPEGMYMEHEGARKLLPRLNELESMLRSRLERKIPGVQVERKYFAIAIHYRNSPSGTFRVVHQHVDDLIVENRDFKKGSGKKIVEIKPSLDWHKGKAVDWILENLEMDDMDRYIPVYTGDDVTDEDAFRALSDDGIGILVGEHSMPSAAHFRLENVEEVNKFLHFLVHSVASK